VCIVKTKLKTVTAQLVRTEMQLEVVSFNRLNCLTVSVDRADCGRRFHTSGPAIEKARLPELCSATRNNDVGSGGVAADRSCCRPGLLAIKINVKKLTSLKLGVRTTW